MTIECVNALPGEYRTPCSKRPSVTPVAAKKTLSDVREVVRREDLVEVVAGVLRARAFVVVARPQAAEHVAAEALHRARRDDALGRAADAEQQVDAGLFARGVDRPGDVAVGDEEDPAPALRTAAMSSSCRGRSRIVTPISAGLIPSAFATR